MNQKKQLCSWSMSVMLVLGAALALSGHAQAQVATSPWTASDLQGGFSEVSGENLGGALLSASTEPIVLTTTNPDQAMELNVTFASTSTIPEDLRFGAWQNAQSFASGGIDTVNATILLDESAFTVVEANYTAASDGSAVTVYSATFNEANLGTAQYTELMDAVGENPNNVFSIYANQAVAVGESFSVISSMPVDGDVLKYRNPQGNFTQFDEGLATQAILSPIASVPQLGDVNLDGTVSFDDIPAFIAVLQSGVFQVEADCNQDGMVDFSDIPAFIAILTNQ